jgi:hypothetical protein
MKVYDGTVQYGLCAKDICLLVKIRGGYVIETPEILEYKWIRGQFVETLADFFSVVTPLHYMTKTEKAYIM